MRLGMGLPNTMAHETGRALMLDTARLADDAGFAALGVIDKPNYDSWEPLTTLAGVAGVTERIGLATSILQLPPRNEVLVAKQAAVVDRLSGGRLILGVAQGGRADDYELLGVPFQGRSARFEPSSSPSTCCPRTSRTAATLARPACRVEAGPPVTEPPRTRAAPPPRPLESGMLGKRSLRDFGAFSPRVGHLYN